MTSPLCILPIALAVGGLAATVLATAPSIVHAQASSDSLVSVTVRVRRDTTTLAPPLEGALVRSAGRGSARADADGVALLRLPVGSHTIVATRIGYRPDSVTLTLRLGADTSVALALLPQPVDVDAVIVSATRSERRVEDTPLRVETIDEEEIAEKVAMSPGDIAMMLNETGGLRVQATNPALGGANVRVQGLRGRYSLMLADGLPLYGGQTGGLGLLQIPPVDLARVEIIKGAASALYGSSALGGVVNLLSRRPGDEPELSALVNRTSRGGTDGVAFLAAPLSERWRYTLLAGAHDQTRNDLDDDGWTDMAGYRRYVARPRLYFDDGDGRTAFLTAGYTSEAREGGTLRSGVFAGSDRWVEAIDTHRSDLGALVRWTAPQGGSLLGVRALESAILTLRGSGVEQRHLHTFGMVQERDLHRTWFGEASLAIPRGVFTSVVGIAMQREEYTNRDLRQFDYGFSVPALFVQGDLDPSPWISLSTSARLDAHSVYGTVVNPRVSALLRTVSDGAFAGWSVRASAGTGAFAPTPFTEETEATGLTPLAPLGNLDFERARSGSLDVGGPLNTPLGRVEINATGFASRVKDPVQVVGLSSATPDGASRIALVHASGPTRTWGSELLARLVHPFGESEQGESAEEHEAPTLRVTATYTFLRSRECDLAGVPTTAGCARREVPLTPRHAAGLVATIEQEGRSRIGLELYYTGRQALADNPYRTESRPYLIVGLMGERAIETRAGTARLFLNLENIGDVRQTRWDPLLLPARGAGGRWTTDVWSDLSGFTVNGGLRFAF